jgi:hypothetical protein
VDGISHPPYLIGKIKVVCMKVCEILLIENKELSEKMKGNSHEKY